MFSSKSLSLPNMMVLPDKPLVVQTSQTNTVKLLENIINAYYFIPLNNINKSKFLCLTPEILKSFGVPVVIVDGSVLTKQINKLNRLVTIGPFKFLSSGNEAIIHAGAQTFSFIECVINFFTLFEKECDHFLQNILPIDILKSLQLKCNQTVQILINSDKIIVKLYEQEVLCESGISENEIAATIVSKIHKLSNFCKNCAQISTLFNLSCKTNNIYTKFENLSDYIETLKILLSFIKLNESTILTSKTFILANGASNNASNIKIPAKLSLTYSTTKLEKRIQLVKSYRSVLFQEKTDIEIFRNMIANNSSLFDITTKQHDSGKFETRVIVKNITQIFCLDSNKIESLNGAIIKTIKYIKSLSKLIDSFKSIISVYTLPEQIVTLLQKENNELIQFYTKKTQFNEYNTIINIDGMVSFNSKSIESQKNSELTVFETTIDYMKKFAQIDTFKTESKLSDLTLLMSSLFNQQCEILKTEANLHDPDLPSITNELLPTLSFTFAQLINEFNLLSLTQQTNIFKIINNLNSKSKLLSVQEATQICYTKNVKIYSATLCVTNITTFQSLTYKKRDAIGIVGLKLIQFISQWKTAVKHFSHVSFLKMKPLQIVNTLKNSCANNLIVFDNNNSIQLKNIGRFVGKDIEDAAAKFYSFFYNLYAIPKDTDLKEEIFNVITNWVCIYDKVCLSANSEKQILEEISELGVEVSFFSNVLNDNVSKNEFTRSCVKLDDLIIFETVNSDLNLSIAENNKKVISYLQSISNLFLSFNQKTNFSSFSENFKTLCFFLKNFPMLFQIYVYKTNEKFLFVLEFLKIYTFVSRQSTFFNSIYEISTKLVGCLNIFKKNFFGKTFECSNLKNEMFVKTLLKRYKLVIQENNDLEMLQIVEQLKKTNVFIETIFIKENCDVSNVCQMKIGRINCLEFKAAGDSKHLAKKEVLKVFCETLKLALETNNIEPLFCYIKQKNIEHFKNGKFLSEPKLFKQQENIKSPLLLDSSFAHTIYQAVVCQWKKLPLEDRRCKVLAAFVLTSEIDKNDVRVLSIGTGSKIIPSEAISFKGNVVHDSHAEVIARRALVCLLYEHLQTLAENEFNDKQEVILQPILSDSLQIQGFSLKSHLKLHLYVTRPPCGAAFKILDNKLRVKVEAKNFYLTMEETYISSFCKIQEGEQSSTFMACSDKVAKWNVVGIQGAVLSAFIQPIYLSSLLVSDDHFDYDTFVESFYGRVNKNLLKSYLKDNSFGYKLNCHKIGNYKPKSFEFDFDLSLPKIGPKCSSQSVNWYRSIYDTIPTFVEILNSRKGTLFDDETKQSRLSKKSFVQQYKNLLFKHPQILSMKVSKIDAKMFTRSINKGTYQHLKEQSTAYQNAKESFIATCEESKLGKWIHFCSGAADIFPL